MTTENFPPPVIDLAFLLARGERATRAVIDDREIPLRNLRSIDQEARRAVLYDHFPIVDMPSGRLRTHVVDFISACVYTIDAKGQPYGHVVLPRRSRTA